MRKLYKNVGDLPLTQAASNRTRLQIVELESRITPAWATGEDILVNSYTNDYQSEAAIASSRSGDFVVVWTGFNNGSDSDIYGQMYDKNGAKSGSEFLINTYTSDAQFHPSIAMDSEGNFVVCWTITSVRMIRT